MRKIEIVEAGGFRHGTDHFQEGEIRMVDDALAGEFIRLGWAKCVATGEVGDRKPGSQKIAVNDSVQVAAG